MPFPVYIEAPAIVAPSDATQSTDALLADCSAALRDELCVLGVPEPGRLLEARRALVVLRGQEADELAIWVHHGDGAISYRELRFTPRDPLRERWRAAGLVVASLLRVPEPQPQLPLATAPVPPIRTVVSGLPKPAAHRPRREYWGGWVAATSGNWSAHAPWLFGAAIGAEGYPTRQPFGLLVSAELSRSFADLNGVLRVSRRSFSVGLVAALPEREKWWVAFRAQVTREWLTASAIDSTGREDSGQTWRTGASLALAPSLELRPGLSAHLGAQVALFASEPNVFVGDHRSAQAAKLTTTFCLGIRAGF